MANKIVFARTRHNYDSYTDYWKLVELSGYPVVYVDQIDASVPQVSYIASPFNGEFFGLGDKKRAPGTKIYLWNLERPGGSGGIEEYKRSNLEHISNHFIDDVIVSDRALAKLTNFTYVPMGSHPKLGEPWSTKLFGFIHLMCYSNRRGMFFTNPSSPRNSFAGCSIAPNGWGDARHYHLQRSWYMLNIHQDEYEFMEPLRFALATSYGLTILSENLAAEPFPYQHGVIQFPLKDIELAMMSAMRNRHELARMGGEMYEFVMTHHTFRQCIERKEL